MVTLMYLKGHNMFDHVMKSFISLGVMLICLSSGLVTQKFLMTYWKTFFLIGLFKLSIGLFMMFSQATYDKMVMSDPKKLKGKKLE